MPARLSCLSALLTALALMKGAPPFIFGNLVPFKANKIRGRCPRNKARILTGFFPSYFHRFLSLSSRLFNLYKQETAQGNRLRPSRSEARHADRSHPYVGNELHVVLVTTVDEDFQWVHAYFVHTRWPPRE